MKENVNYVKDKNQEEITLLLAYKRDNEGDDNIWYLTTSTSNHMCGRRNMFVELNV